MKLLVVKCWLGWLGFGWLLFAVSVQAAEVSVELSGAGQRLIKIAVTPFIPQGDVSADMESQLSAVLQNDLRISGFFDTLAEEGVRIDSLHNADLNSGGIQFKEWDALGARLLVKGMYEQVGATIKIECRVYATQGGDFILGKRYESDAAHLRTIVHRFADEIILKMTGERGMSASKIVFTSDRSGNAEVYQIDFDGENLKQLTHEEALVVAPAVSPDGEKIAYTSYKDNNPDLYVMTVATGETECVAMFPGLNFAAAWAPDGQALALTLSKDGNPELYLIDPASQEATRLTNNKWNDVSPSWSPDGSEIVYTADNIGAPQLYILNRAGSAPRRLTFRGSYNVSPSWSPTGEFIAFSSSMDGDFNIYVVQANGDNLRQLTQNQGNNEDPAFSLDGRYIAFQSTRDGSKAIYIMNTDGTNQRRLTDDRSAALSPAWMR